MSLVGVSAAAVRVVAARVALDEASLAGEADLGEAGLGGLVVSADQRSSRRCWCAWKDVAWSSSSIILDVHGPPASGSKRSGTWSDYLTTAAAAHLGLPEVERESETTGPGAGAAGATGPPRRPRRRRCRAGTRLDGPDGPVRLTHKRLHTRARAHVFGRCRSPGSAMAPEDSLPSIPLTPSWRPPAGSTATNSTPTCATGLVCGPFDEAISVIAEMTGVAHPEAQAEAIVKDAAADFDDFYVKRTSDTASRPAEAILVGAIDCKGIPMVKPDGAARSSCGDAKAKRPTRRRWRRWLRSTASTPCVRTPKEVLDSLFRSPDAPPRQKRRAVSRGQACLGEPDLGQGQLHRRGERRDDTARPRPPPHLGDGHRRRASPAAPGGRHLQ